MVTKERTSSNELHTSSFIGESKKNRKQGKNVKKVKIKKKLV